MPKLKFVSRAKPSLYGYPPALEKEKKEEKGKVGGSAAVTGELCV